MAVKLDEARVRLLKIIDTGNLELPIGADVYSNASLFFGTKTRIGTGTNNTFGIYSTGKIMLRPNNGTLGYADGFELSTTTLIPTKNNTVTLGDSTHYWKHIYATQVTSTTASGTSCAFTEVRTNGPSVSFGVGSGNVNHGVYSNTLGKWIAYADATNIYLNGNALTATALTSNAGSSSLPIYFTGGKPAAVSNIEIKATDTTSKSIKVTNSNGSVGIHTSTNQGLYDFIKSSWIIYRPTGTSSTYIPAWANIGSSYVPTYHGANGVPTAVTANSVITNLASTSGASIFAASPRPGVTGTLPITNGGTGNTAVTANRLAWTESASKITADYHYASSTKVAIASTAEPTETFLVNGASRLDSTTIIAHKLPAITAPAVGWYRVAEIAGRLSYLNCLVLITGSYSSTNPSHVLLHISGMHNSPTIKQIGGYKGQITSARITGEKGSYYLEIYLGTTTTGQWSETTFQFIGNVKLKTTYTPTTPNGAESTYTSTASIRTMKDTITFAVADNSATNTGTAVTYDSSANITLKLPATIKATLTGNASTATKLAAKVAINGTDFDGSSAITTVKWGTARTLTIGNKGQSVNGNVDVSWALHDILYNSSHIGASTSWDITTPGVYYVASSSAFTGTGHPESSNGGTTPYRYGQLIVSRANTGGLAQFYISHNDSGTNTGYGIKFRTGWSNSYLGTWRTLMDSTNYTNWCDGRYVNTAGDTMTGDLKFTTKGIHFVPGNTDQYLWKVYSTTDGSYGFRLQYNGAGAGNDNSLSLFADNQEGTEIKAVTILQDGTAVLAVNPQFKTTNYTSTPITIYDDATTYGHTLLVGAGGTTYVGAGESASGLYSKLAIKSTEDLILGADSNIKFYTNADNATTTSGITLDTTNQFYPQTTNTGSLGTSSYKWAKMYATTFYGSLSGNATSASKLIAYEARATTTDLNKAANYGGAGALFHLVASTSTTTGKCPTDANVMQMNWDNNGGCDSQFAIATRSSRAYFRPMVSKGTAWREFAHIAAGTLTGSTTIPVYVNAEGAVNAVSANSVIVNLASTSGASIYAAAPRPGVTGILPLANGGTDNNLSNATKGSIVYVAADGSGLWYSTVGSSGQVLTSGASGAPTWTTATNSSTASTIVKRDSSGNFSAGTITAALSGNASTATSLSHSVTLAGNSSTSGVYWNPFTWTVSSSWSGTAGIYALVDIENAFTGIFQVKFRTGTNATTLGNHEVKWLSASTPTPPTLTLTTVIGSSNTTYRLYITAPGTYRTYRIYKITENGTAGTVATAHTTSITGTAQSTANTTVSSRLGTSTIGSTTKPIYLSSGEATQCSTYAGGTAVTLNGTSKAASTASFYAPTSVGTSGYILKSNGSGAPTWLQTLPIANGGTGATTRANAWTNIVAAGGTFTGSLTISHTTSATMDSTTTNPRIVFSESGSQAVGLVYTDYDSYRSPAGLKVLDMSGSNGNVWFEVTGEIIAGTKVTSPSFVGALTGNATTATTLANTRSLKISGTPGTTGTNFNGGADATLIIPSTVKTFTELGTNKISSTAALYISPASTLYVDSAASTSLIFRPQGAEKARFDTSGNFLIKTAMYPGTNNTYSLGTSSYRWSNVYSTAANFSRTLTGAAANFSDNVTLTRSTTIANNTPAKLTFTVTQTDNSLTSSGYIACYDDLDTAGYGVNMVVNATSGLYLTAGEGAASYLANNASVSEDVHICADAAIYFHTNCNTVANSTKSCYITTAGYIYGARVYGAVWNDYAEYRTTDRKIEAGRVVVENNDDTLSLATERLQPGANIVSDTFGFAIGETEKAKTPLAVSGRVLAYPFEPREEYCAGDPVCSGPNGTVSKMTREEVMMYPDRMIGTVSAVPNYETWGTGNIPVNGRIWIKV